MNLKNLLLNCGFLYRVVRKTTQPPDQILSEYFRKKKFIGSKERKFCSELVFSLIRNELLVEFILTKYFSGFQGSYNLKINNLIYNDTDVTDQTRKLLIFLFLNLFSNEFKFLDLPNLLIKISSQYSSKDAILNELANDFEFNITDELFFTTFDNITSDFNYILNNNILNSEFFENYYSFPTFLFDKIKDSLDNNQLLNLVSSLNISANPCLRINSLLFMDLIKNELKSNEIPYKISEIAPLGIELLKRINLNEYDFFKRGLAEVQDIGSQIIPYALNPSENSRILDACAGAGGKSLQLASITNDNSEITANDVEYGRMKELHSRARRAGFDSIRIKNLNSVTIYKEHYDYFDYILIDAPCSGLGTIRRSPLLKYKINQKSLDKINKTQLEIINYYSKLLVSGGILVYATCSFLPQENRMIIEKFLELNYEFEIDFLKPVFASNNIIFKELKEESFDLTLYPNLHNTDSFYMARLRKK